MLPTGNYNDIQYFGALHSDGSVSTLNLDTSNHNGLGLLLSKRFECRAVYQERHRGRKSFRLPRARQSCSGLFHAEQGRHRFTDSLYAHGGDWKQALAVERGYEFNYELAAFRVQPHTGAMAAEPSYVSVDASALVLAAMKKTEDGDGSLPRFYEWA